MLLAKYNTETGKDIAFFNTEENYKNGIPSQTIEITEQQRNDYFTKGAECFSIQKVNGIWQWMYMEPSEPTSEELHAQDLTALDAEYQPQFADLAQALGMATLADNTVLIASIKVDYADLKDEYDTKREEINNG